VLEPAVLHNSNTQTLHYSHYSIDPRPRRRDAWRDAGAPRAGAFQNAFRL